MSKGNIFMGNASGKLADVVLYRNAGAQVARLRVRKPKNPRTTNQVIQRVLQSTNSKAYSVLQFICNHSFEGRVGNTANQSAFMKANIARDRYRVSVAPMGWRALDRFNSKTAFEPLANNYIISEGSLPEVQFTFGETGFTGMALAGEEDSYQGVVDALGLQRGDQLTFVAALGDSSTGVMTGLKVQRVILEPSSGDMSAQFILNGRINLPNEKNEGSIGVFNLDQSGLSLTAPGCIAGGVIVSRLSEGNKWLRSSCRMGAYGATIATLGEAVDSWIPETSSDKYLNQAEVIRLGGE